MPCNVTWWNAEYGMWCRCEREREHQDKHRCRCEERLPPVETVLTDRGWTRVR